jgi:hypothetical protein
MPLHIEEGKIKEKQQHMLGSFMSFEDAKIRKKCFVLQNQMEKLEGMKFLVPALLLFDIYFAGVK